MNTLLIAGALVLGIIVYAILLATDRDED